MLKYKPGNGYAAGTEKFQVFWDGELCHSVDCFSLKIEST